MKTLTITALLILTFIAGCGDDNTTNNPGPPPANYTVDSLVFEKDSLVVISTDSAVSAATGEFYTDSLDGFRVTFNAQTNSDTAYMILTVGVPFDEIYELRKRDSAINGSYDLVIDTRNEAGYFLSLSLTVMSRLNNPPAEYIRLKDIKVYRITYN